jgi:hypothetical protein
LLSTEAASVASVGDFADFFEDELADWHSGFEDDNLIADVEDFKLDGKAGVVGIFGVIPEAGVDGWGGHVYADAEAGEAAFALNPRSYAGCVRQVDFLLGVAEDEQLWA